MSILEWDPVEDPVEGMHSTIFYAKYDRSSLHFCVQAWSRGARSARLHKELQASKINEVVLITLCIVFYMTGKMWKASELVLQSSVPEDELISHQLSFSKVTQSANRDLQK